MEFNDSQLTTLITYRASLSKDSHATQLTVESVWAKLAANCLWRSDLKKVSDLRPTHHKSASDNFENVLGATTVKKLVKSTASCVALLPFASTRQSLSVAADAEEGLSDDRLTDFNARSLFDT